MHQNLVLDPPLPTRLQLHSARHHNIYNGAKPSLPVAIWVRSPTVWPTAFSDSELVFEVVLYYRGNRACNLYRAWDDFKALDASLRSADVPRSNHGSIDLPPSGPSLVIDVQDLNALLRKALEIQPDGCATEYFLRRRMEDCSSA